MLLLLCFTVLPTLTGAAQEGDPPELSTLEEEEATTASVPDPTEKSAQTTSGREEPSRSPRTPERRADVNTSTLNSVTQLEFSQVGERSRIHLGFRSTPRYREVTNPQVKQVIYFFENTETPQKFQRAYDTSEFSSPVALFTLLQMPKEKPPLSKLIIQLREDKPPSVVSSERGLAIEFPSPTEKKEPKIVVGDGDSLPSEDNIYQSDRIFTGKPIQRLEVKNSDIQDVLRFIARSSGYNIVIADEVKGPVGTLSLENIPWDQAFALVLQSKRLGYIRQGNVIRVAPLDLLSKEKDDAAKLEQSKAQVEPLKTVLIPLSYAKADELKDKAAKFLTQNRGTIDTDPRTNTLIVKDIDSVVTRIQKLIAALDTPPPLVSISAKIVELKGDFSRKYGFGSWKANATIFSGINFDQTLQLPVSQTWQTTIKAPDYARLETIFTMAESDNKTKVLANPAVTVAANKTGKVTQSVNTVIPGVSIIAGGATVPTLQTVSAQLSLTVNPIVSNDGVISMNVSLENTFLTSAQGNTDSRSINTDVIADNGDTIVLGGLFKNTVTQDKQGVPFFMNVPILGFFFSATGRTDQRNEILIFLTPKILNAEDTFKRTL